MARLANCYSHSFIRLLLSLSASASKSIVRDAWWTTLSDSFVASTTLVGASSARPWLRRGRDRIRPREAALQSAAISDTHDEATIQRLRALDALQMEAPAAAVRFTFTAPSAAASRSSGDESGPAAGAAGGPPPSEGRTCGKGKQYDHLYQGAMATSASTSATERASGPGPAGVNSDRVVLLAPTPLSCGAGRNNEREVGRVRVCSLVSNRGRPFEIKEQEVAGIKDQEVEGGSSAIVPPRVPRDEGWLPWSWISPSKDEQWSTSTSSSSATASTSLYAEPLYPLARHRWSIDQNPTDHELLIDEIVET